MPWRRSKQSFAPAWTGQLNRLPCSIRTCRTFYREKVTQPARGLEYEESRTAAAEALRGLIDAIVLTPQEGELKIELQGNPAAMLKAAHGQSTGPQCRA